MEIPGILISIVVEQGKPVSNDIRRRHDIVAELVELEEGEHQCQNCSSVRTQEFRLIEYEYRAAGTYYTVGPTGSNFYSNSRERRDKIDTQVYCEYCGHTISLGITWSEYEAVPSLYNVTVDPTASAGGQYIINSTGTSSGGDVTYHAGDTTGGVISPSGWTK